MKYEIFVFNNFWIKMRRINIMAIQYLNIPIIALYVLNYRPLPWNIEKIILL